MLKYWMVGLLFLVSAASAMAKEPLLDLTTSPDWFALGPPTGERGALQLAGAPTRQALVSEAAPIEEEKPLFKPRLLTLNNTHKYLGIGSLVLATATVFVEKDYGGLHESLAEGAAALGVAAVATGLTFHYEDLKFSNGLRDPDNLHALLGILGTLGYLIAVDEGGDGTHATAGILGAASMFYAIKLTW